MKKTALLEITVCVCYREMGRERDGGGKKAVVHVDGVVGHRRHQHHHRHRYYVYTVTSPPPCCVMAHGEKLLHGVRV